MREGRRYKGEHGRRGEVQRMKKSRKRRGEDGRRDEGMYEERGEEKRRYVETGRWIVGRRRRGEGEE